MLNIAWLLWYNRNQRWVGEALEIAVNSEHTFSNLAMEFMEVQKSNEMRMPIEECRWRPPIGMYIIR